jgi:hypothetical protein
MPDPAAPAREEDRFATAEGVRTQPRTLPPDEERRATPTPELPAVDGEERRQIGRPRVDGR